MKVLSINLNTYQEDHQFDKFMKIAKTICDEQIDVVLFCEAGQSLMSPYVEGDIRKDNAVKIICDKVNEILGSQVYKFKWEMVHFGFKVYEEGLAIMSKHPLENINSTYVSKTSDHFTFKSRKVIKASIQNVDFYTIHLGWEDDEAEPTAEQLNQLHDYILRQSAGKKVIVGGTFNSDVRTKTYRDMISKGYVDLYTQFKPEGKYEETYILPQGYNRRGNFYRLDYFFSNQNNLKIKNAKYMFEGQERVSDHVGIFIELEVE